MLLGNLFVISAPSGTGKSTILKQVLTSLPRVSFSISHTTRSPRPAERDGVDYHFVDREGFLTLRDQDGFLEWAEVHGNFYGTSRGEVGRKLGKGIDLFLDIDVQGAQQIREQSGVQAVFLFIAPPSMAELERRLSGRGTESRDSLQLRLANAAREMAAIDQYDYVIVNDQVESAAEVLRAIIIAERSRRRRSADGEPLVLPAPARP